MNEPSSPTPAWCWPTRCCRTARCGGRRPHRRHRRAATAAGRRAIDLEGDYLLPGLVEVHTDNLERHLMPRPKVQLGRAARRCWRTTPKCAAAGITTVFDALGVGDTDARQPARAATWDALLGDARHRQPRRPAARRPPDLHVRCELPAPNTIELFEPFAGAPAPVADLADGPHAGPAPVGRHRAGAHLLHRQEGLERREVRAPGGACRQRCRRSTPQPHRAYFVDYCRAHGIALASHDDTTDGACASEAA